MNGPDVHASENLAECFERLGNIQNDFRNKNLYALLLSFLKQGSLLDIGSGAGHFLALARQHGFRATGIEPNASLIELSEKIYGKMLDVRNFSVEQINQLEGRYDNIVMIDVLEHIEQDETMLSELRRHLAPDGRLVILVPCFRHLYGKRDQMLGHYRRYEKSELIGKLEQSGYDVIKNRYWNMLGYLPYLIAEKLARKEISTSLRTAKKKNILQVVAISVLNGWFQLIENRIN